MSAGTDYFKSDQTFRFGGGILYGNSSQVHFADFTATGSQFYSGRLYLNAGTTPSIYLKSDQNTNYKAVDISTATTDTFTSNWSIEVNLLNVDSGPGGDTIQAIQWNGSYGHIFYPGQHHKITKFIADGNSSAKTVDVYMAIMTSKTGAYLAYIQSYVKVASNVSLGSGFTEISLDYPVHIYVDPIYDKYIIG